MVVEANKTQVAGADETGVQVSALEHPMALAALSRLASSGAWQRVIDGQPLIEEIDLVDAAFLVAAGAVTRVADNTFRVGVSDPLYGNCQALADWTHYLLRRALRHATGRSVGWTDEDPETLLSFGRASGRGADIIADLLLAQVPEIAAVFTAGRGCFLDVGVGVGAISIGLVKRFPGTAAVGLDVSRQVLDLAHAEVARSGLAGDVELRLQSVADLGEQDRYDLAWVPQGFIPRHAFLAGVGNVFSALKPGGVAVIPVDAQAGISEFARARQAHSAYLAGGSTFTRSELLEVLDATGFVDPVEHPVGAQVLMTLIKPALGWSGATLAVI